MPILFVLLALAVIALIFGPQYWVRAVMRRHAQERPDFPGTGGELARHLLDMYGLRAVKVELTADGDHYDPMDKAVRLTPANHDGRSVTAVAVAAHEVGHAWQDAQGHRLLTWRTRFAGTMRRLEVAAAIVFASAPIVALILKSPLIAIVQVLLAVLLLSGRLVFHILTLPVEFDASFGKALPALVEGRYLAERDVSAARQVLKAAALTYVAAALVTLLDFGRIIRILR